MSDIGRAVHVEEINKEKEQYKVTVTFKAADKNRFNVILTDFLQGMTNEKIAPNFEAKRNKEKLCISVEANGKNIGTINNIVQKLCAGLES